MMKKILLGLASFMMFLSLCGCAGDSNKNDNQQEIDKSVAIELTMDNWQDYFDLGMSEKEFRNEFGELERVHKCVVLILKDEYTLSEKDGSEITVELSYDGEHHYYQLIESEDKVEWLGSTVVDEGQSKILTTFNELIFNENMFLLSTGGGYGKDHSNPYVYVLGNVEVTKIQGTLYLSE